MSDSHSVADSSSTRQLLGHPSTTNEQPDTKDSKNSLWQKLKTENKERKEKEVQYVSSETAEAISGYGEERTKKEEQERIEQKEKGGNTNLVGAMLL